MGRQDGDSVDDRVTPFAEFASRDLESAYRLRHAPTDRLLGRCIIVVAAVATVGMAGLDNTLFPDGGPELLTLGVARWTFFALSGVALALLWGTPTPARFTVVMAVWNVATAALPVAIGVIWPPGHLELRMTASLAVMMTYCVMPLSLRFQTLAALMQTASHVSVIGWLNPIANREALATEVGWLAILNVLGVLLSYRLHSRQRRLFAALQRQSELSASLGRALAEVRTLRGLIRVCAWCRKVDSGSDWQQLEAYIRAHSHAEFTHGICPACLDTATGDIGDGHAAHCGVVHA